MKEIIIDGVNVCECRYYDNGNCYSKDYIFIKCVKNNNCIYRQLQRLKQENEELKRAKSIPMPFIDETLVKELKQENEELKKKINSYVCSANCHKYIQADKYKQALEEIRDLKISQGINDDVLKMINEVLND